MGKLWHKKDLELLEKDKLSSSDGKLHELQNFWDFRITQGSLQWEKKQLLKVFSMEPYISLFYDLTGVPSFIVRRT